MSRYQHRYLWPSPANTPYCSLLPAGLQDRIGTALLYVVSSCLCSSMWRGSQSLLLQQCPACLVRLILIVFLLGGRWLYRCCFVGCCLQELFNIARRMFNNICNINNISLYYVTLDLKNPGIFVLELIMYSSNLRSSLLRCGTRPNEWGAQWDSNSHV